MHEDFAQTLYRILPAYYRERDETGDLKAYLAGCGDLLDAVYATLKQRYADNFPDNPPDGSSQAPAQDWLLPYFADLVDATLVSPLPDGRRDELSHAIRWRQGKGTLNTVESIIEAIGQSEAVIQEGWQRVAMTPRIAAPMRPAVSFGYAQEPEPANPANMARHPRLEAAIVDMRCPSRALTTTPNNAGARRITIDGAETIWRQGSAHGAPCFAGSYEDVSARMPDMRTPDWRVGHFHPHRVLAYVPPPSGFFYPGMTTVTWNDVPSAAYLAQIEIDTSTPGLVVHRNRSLRAGAFRPVRVNGRVMLDAAEAQGARFRFEGISFGRDISASDAHLSFYRCAVQGARAPRADLLEPVIDMKACLTGRLSAPQGRIRLEGVTAMGRVAARAVEASDCIFRRRVHAPEDVSAVPPDGGCLRFPQTLHQPYSGVYQQQGRMITDADWNAAMQVSKDRVTHALADVIGSGTPAQGGIIAGDADAGYAVSWGDVYVDGIRAELTSRSGASAFDLTDQMDFPNATGAPAEAHRLYLDIWERSLTALEEPTLRDSALHGADSSTRTRTMAQVKLCPPAFDPEDPAQNPPIGEGRLTLTLRSSAEGGDPCEPCLDEIDVSARVGNYAFRVEIHHVTRNAAGAPTGLVLKWSRENGSEAAMPGVAPPGFASADWMYEFYNSAAQKSASESHAGFHHPAVLAAGFTEARGELYEGYPDTPSAGFDLVRRWDGYAVFERNGAVWELASQSIDGDPVPHGRDRTQRLSTELGEAQHGHVSEGASVLMSLDTMTLHLELVDHQRLAGDHWIAAVREAEHSAGMILRDDATPDGIMHHYMCLADVDDEGTLTLPSKDACKRFQFPALTNIHADDVCFDNATCDLPGVGNVQEALDHLCQQKDLKWHNKHLHGWGIVCGLIAECCDPSPDEDRDEDPIQCLTLTKGYAIDCDGCDIVVEDHLHVDLLEDVRGWDAENPDDPILRTGNDTACLYIEQDAGEPVVRVEPHQGGDDNFLTQLMDGTLLGDFVQTCILDLIGALTAELSFLEEGKLPTDENGSELVSVERRKLISFSNLVLQIAFKDNGPYVWMSRREYEILRDLYDCLRDLLGSKNLLRDVHGQPIPRLRL